MSITKEQHALNVSKSTGAITKSGKARSSRNAVKHGLRSAKPPLLLSEDRDEYDRVLKSLHEQYDPQGELENLCIEQIAVLVYKQRRLWKYEAAIANLAALEAQLEETQVHYPTVGGIQVDFDLGTTATISDEIAFLSGKLLAANKVELPDLGTKYAITFMKKRQIKQITPKHIPVLCRRVADGVISMQDLHAVISDRLAYLNSILEQQSMLHAEIRQLKLDEFALHISSQEVCDRYQRSITRELDLTIKRFHTLKEAHQGIAFTVG